MQSPRRYRSAASDDSAADLGVTLGTMSTASGFAGWRGAAQQWGSFRAVAEKTGRHFSSEAISALNALLSHSQAEWRADDEVWNAEQEQGRLQWEEYFTKRYYKKVGSTAPAPETPHAARQQRLDTTQKKGKTASMRKKDAFDGRKDAEQRLRKLLLDNREGSLSGSTRFGKRRTSIMVTRDAAVDCGLSFDSSLVITRVDDSSMAFDAGLRVGSHLVAVNGVSVTDKAHANELIAAAGSNVRLSLEAIEQKILPKGLFVTPPPAQAACAGWYQLVPSQAVNDFPVWERAGDGGEKGYLYSTTDGKWALAPSPYAMANNQADVYAAERHAEQSPVEYRDKWQEPVGHEWADVGGVRIKDLPAAPWCKQAEKPANLATLVVEPGQRGNSASADLDVELTDQLAVVSVDASSPLGCAGLVPGSVVVAVDGEPVGSKEDLMKALKGMRDVYCLTVAQPTTADVTPSSSLCPNKDNFYSMITDASALREFGNRLVREWDSKPGTVIDELAANLVVPEGRDPVKLLGEAAVALQRAKGAAYPDKNLAELLVMATYTMTGPDIDSLLGFDDVPIYDADNPAVWFQYCDTYHDRNDAISNVLSWSCREAVDPKSTRHKEAWDTLRKWIKYLGLVTSLASEDRATDARAAFSRMDTKGTGKVAKGTIRKHLDANPALRMRLGNAWTPWDEGDDAVTLKEFLKDWSTVDPGSKSEATVSRGVAGLSAQLFEAHRDMGKGSKMHWPAPASCASDRSVSEAVLQAAAADAPLAKGNRSILFLVEGCSFGLPLQAVSKYPKEAELLLPPLSSFSVREAASAQIPGSTDDALVVRVECVSALGNAALQPFSRSCRRDAAAADADMGRAITGGHRAAVPSEMPAGTPVEVRTPNRSDVQWARATIVERKGDGYIVEWPEAGSVKQQLVPLSGIRTIPVSDKLRKKLIHGGVRKEKVIVRNLAIKLPVASQRHADVSAMMSTSMASTGTIPIDLNNTSGRPMPPLEKGLVLEGTRVTGFDPLWRDVFQKGMLFPGEKIVAVDHKPVATEDELQAALQEADRRHRPDFEWSVFDDTNRGTPARGLIADGGGVAPHLLLPGSPQSSVSTSDSNKPPRTPTTTPLRALGSSSARKHVVHLRTEIARDSLTLQRLLSWLHALPKVLRKFNLDAPAWLAGINSRDPSSNEQPKDELENQLGLFLEGRTVIHVSPGSAAEAAGLKVGCELVHVALPDDWSGHDSMRDKGQQVLSETEYLPPAEQERGLKRLLTPGAVTTVLYPEAYLNEHKARQLELLVRDQTVETKVLTSKRYSSAQGPFGVSMAGPVVVGVQPMSRAEALGLVPGAVITTVHGEPVDMLTGDEIERLLNTPVDGFHSVGVMLPGVSGAKRNWKKEVDRLDAEVRCFDVDFMEVKESGEPFGVDLVGSVIVGVWKNGLAAKAGCRIGCRIAEVDGKEIRDVPGDLAAVVNGRGGADRRLLISAPSWVVNEAQLRDEAAQASELAAALIAEREAAPAERKLVTTDGSDGVDVSAFGIELLGTTIVSVAAGSPAERLGCRKGTRLVAINGKATTQAGSDAIFDRLSRAFEAGPTELTLSHPLADDDSRAKIAQLLSELSCITCREVTIAKPAGSFGAELVGSTIASVFPDSPAEDNHCYPGCRVSKVDGQETLGMSSDEVAELLTADSCRRVTIAYPFDPQLQTELDECRLRLRQLLADRALQPVTERKIARSTGSRAGDYGVELAGSTVVSVVDGSEASRHGCVPGCRLVAVDGRDTADLDGDAIQSMLNDLRSTSVTVSFPTSQLELNEARAAIFRLAAELSRQPYVKKTVLTPSQASRSLQPLGVTLHGTTITSVLPGSEADRLGITPGCRILTIDQKSPSRLLQEDLQSLLDDVAPRSLELAVPSPAALVEQSQEFEAMLKAELAAAPMETRVVDSRAVGSEPFGATLVGATVTSVVKGSPAERTGLTPGCRILKVGDAATDSMSQSAIDQCVQDSRGQQLLVAAPKLKRQLEEQKTIVKQLLAELAAAPMETRIVDSRAVGSEPFGANLVGATVTSVVKGSPAERTGLMPGCRILRVGDAATDSMSQSAIDQCVQDSRGQQLLVAAPKLNRQLEEQKTIVKQLLAELERQPQREFVAEKRRTGGPFGVALMGSLIVSVLAGSEADALGCRPGGRILRIGDRSVKGLGTEEIKDLLENSRSDTIAVAVPAGLAAADERDRLIELLSAEISGQPGVTRTVDGFGADGELRKNFGLELVGSTVTRVQPNSEAERQGVQPGHRITAVNRSPTLGLSSEEVFGLLRESAGKKHAPSQVAFTVPLAQGRAEAALRSLRRLFLQWAPRASTPKTVETGLLLADRGFGAELVGPLVVSVAEGSEAERLGVVPGHFVLKVGSVETTGMRDDSIKSMLDRSRGEVVELVFPMADPEAEGSSEKLLDLLDELDGVPCTEKEVVKPATNSAAFGAELAGCTVVSVAPGSPADRLGCRPGCRVVSIDNVRTRDLSPNQVKHALNEKSSQTVVLAFPNFEAALQATIEHLKAHVSLLKAEISSRPSIEKTVPRGEQSRFGVELIGTTITSVAPDSQASRAGCYPGCRVVRVDHQKSLDLPLDDLKAALDERGGCETVAVAFPAGDVKLQREIEELQRRISELTDELDAAPLVACTAATAANAADLGDFGVEMVGSTVVAVRRGSEAERIGLASGCRVLRVNGTETKGMGGDDVSSLLDSRRAKTVVFGRPAAEAARQRQLDSVLDALRVGGVGGGETALHKPGGGGGFGAALAGTTVTSVAPGSKADDLGLVAGCSVVKVNGMNTADMPAEHLQDLLDDREPRTLTVTFPLTAADIRAEMEERRLKHTELTAELGAQPYSKEGTLQLPPGTAASGLEFVGSTVVSVASGSEAERQGWLKGCRIVKVGYRGVSTFKAGELRSVLRRGEVEGEEVQVRFPETSEDEVKGLRAQLEALPGVEFTQVVNIGKARGQAALGMELVGSTVTGVDPDGEAGSWGIVPGCRIVEVNGRYTGLGLGRRDLRELSDVGTRVTWAQPQQAAELVKELKTMSVVERRFRMPDADGFGVRLEGATIVSVTESSKAERVGLVEGCRVLEVDGRRVGFTAKGGEVERKLTPGADVVCAVPVGVEALFERLSASRSVVERLRREMEALPWQPKRHRGSLPMPSSGAEDDDVFGAQLVGSVITTVLPGSPAAHLQCSPGSRVARINNQDTHALTERKIRDLLNDAANPPSDITIAHLVPGRDNLLVDRLYTQIEVFPTARRRITLPSSLERDARIDLVGSTVISAPAGGLAHALGLVPGCRVAEVDGRDTLWADDVEIHSLLHANSALTVLFPHGVVEGARVQTLEAQLEAMPTVCRTVDTLSLRTARQQDLGVRFVGTTVTKVIPGGAGDHLGLVRGCRIMSTDTNTREMLEGMSAEEVTKHLMRECTTATVQFPEPSGLHEELGHLRWCFAGEEDAKKTRDVPVDLPSSSAEAMGWELFDNRIVKIEPGSLAGAAGLEVGQTITAVDGARVRKSGAVEDAVRREAAKGFASLPRRSVVVTVVAPLATTLPLRENEFQTLQGVVTLAQPRTCVLAKDAEESIGLALHGLTVVEMEKGSPAERSGIRLGNVVAAVNGAAAASADDVVRALRDSPHACSITLLAPETFTFPPLNTKDGSTLGIAFEGTRVVAVAPGCSAARAGLEAGMLIVAVNGEPVSTERQTAHALSSVLRGAGLCEVQALRPKGAPANTTILTDHTDGTAGIRDAGATPVLVRHVEIVNVDGRREELGLGLDGNLVTEVVPGSFADRIGLAPGVVITHVNGYAVRSKKELLTTLAHAISATPKGDRLELTIAGGPEVAACGVSPSRSRPGGRAGSPSRVEVNLKREIHHLKEVKARADVHESRLRRELHAAREDVAGLKDKLKETPTDVQLKKMHALDLDARESALAAARADNKRLSARIEALEQQLAHATDQLHKAGGRSPGKPAGQAMLLAALKEELAEAYAARDAALQRAQAQRPAPPADAAELKRLWDDIAKIHAALDALVAAGARAPARRVATPPRTTRDVQREVSSLRHRLRSVRETMREEDTSFDAGGRGHRSLSKRRRVALTALQPPNSRGDVRDHAFPHFGLLLADSLHMETGETVDYLGLRVVSATAPSAPALKEDDLITCLAGQPVMNLEEFREVLSAHAEPWQYLAFTALRWEDGCSREFTVKIKSSTSKTKPGTVRGTHHSSLGSSRATSPDGRTSVALTLGIPRVGSDTADTSGIFPDDPPTRPTANPKFGLLSDSDEEPAGKGRRSSPQRRAKPRNGSPPRASVPFLSPAEYLKRMEVDEPGGSRRVSAAYSERVVVAETRTLSVDAGPDTKNPSPSSKSPHDSGRRGAPPADLLRPGPPAAKAAARSRLLPFENVEPRHPTPSELSPPSTPPPAGGSDLSSLSAAPENLPWDG
ncbi:hypothetical protein DIPPA_01748 [Diplonema papillatum]|nr:hypothetical protein DIPPA_01748 [Diplonema papillatum]